MDLNLEGSDVMTEADIEMRCDKCEHWNPRQRYDPNPLDFRVCSKAIVMWDATDWDCDNMENGRVMRPEFKDQMLCAQDASGDDAIVITRADFFCAHFTKRT